MPIKILVVDDDAPFELLIKQRFRKEIRAKKYEFAFARNGVEALEVIENIDDISMVLSDINMPEMDGLTLLGKLKEVNPVLKTIIVSAYGDMENIRRAMNLGAFDFVTKPIEFTDLRATISKTLEEVELILGAQHARKLASMNEKLQELDQLKSRFFTNISHEFRTPLTVISGMTDQIAEKPERWLNKGIAMIRRNTDNLLDLVNQILDLRKLESGHMHLKLAQGDFVSYLNYIKDSFAGLAEAKDIGLHFESNVPKLVMDYDAEKILRIISNLVGNALKFTPEGGDVSLKVEQQGDKVQIQIEDTGIGIPKDVQEDIFRRFFQTHYSDTFKKAGTGIGLSLVKQLVSLMNGDISLISEIDVGSTFTITLPVECKSEQKHDNLLLPSKDHLHTENDTSISSEFKKVNDSQLELPSLLLVEDNPDVRQYLTACLEGLFKLEIASNGQEGIDLALEKIPDLIISDVMMPEKNGYELTLAIKNDGRTSHIPIILLTAKADLDSKITGLKKGADAYLAKPFEKRELLAQIDQLLEIRNKLQARYQSLDNIRPENISNAAQEDQFILTVKETVHSNIDDESFGITELCRAVGMSRTQLHRKIKALTGRSTSSFIRSIRLNKAKELLTTTDWNISQIAYEVGFKDPKYFSRTFAEEFGESPKVKRATGNG